MLGGSLHSMFQRTGCDSKVTYRSLSSSCVRDPPEMGDLDNSLIALHEYSETLIRQKYGALREVVADSFYVLSPT